MLTLVKIEKAEVLGWMHAKDKDELLTKLQGLNVAGSYEPIIKVVEGWEPLPGKHKLHYGVWILSDG